MTTSTPPTRILHIWDTRVDSGLNIDDLLERAPVRQKSISRVLIRQGGQKPLSQSFQHQLTKILSPYPTGIFNRQLSKIRFRGLIKREISSFKPDLIFFHFGQTAATLIKLVTKYDKPFVVALYGHDISVAIRKLRWRIKYRIFSKTNGRYLVLAEDVRQRVLDLGVRESKISIYNWPLDLSSYLSVDRTPSRGSFRITIPGRFVEKKGHIYLFESVHILKERNIFVDVTAIGYGDTSAYQKIVSELGIGDQVRWIDTTDATIKGDFDKVYAEVLKETDLVVLPCITSSEGDNEAGPALVLCLAQASGTPVLTTAFRGHEISIEDGVTGFLAREKDVSDLTDKIVWAIENPHEINKIAEDAKRHVRQIFDLDSSINEIYRVITSDMKENR